MKKLLLSALLAGVFSSTVQAQASSVNVYGNLDQSYYAIQQASGSTANQSGLNSHGWSTSRFGLRGTEDAGGGLTFGFQLESQVSLGTGAVGSSTTGAAQSTTGTAEVFNRAANISAKTKGFGEIKIGRQINPLYAVVSANDALGVNGMGLINYWVLGSRLNGTNVITGQDAGTNIGGASTSGTTPQIFSNGISYTTPDVKGLTASLFTSPGSGSATTINAGIMREATLRYVQGGFTASAGYGTVANTTGATALRNSVFGASYQFDKFKISAAKTMSRFDNNLFTSRVGNDLDITTAGIKYQVTAPMWVGVEYTVAQDKYTTANKSSTTGLAVNYDLSKRTSLYSMLATTDNSGVSKMTAVYGSAAAMTSGVDNKSLSVGMKHSF
jgi:predicted porin